MQTTTNAADFDGFAQTFDATLSAPTAAQWAAIDAAARQTVPTTAEVIERLADARIMAHTLDLLALMRSSLKIADRAQTLATIYQVAK